MNKPYLCPACHQEVNHAIAIPSVEYCDAVVELCKEARELNQHDHMIKPASGCALCDWIENFEKVMERKS